MSLGISTVSLTLANFGHGPYEVTIAVTHDLARFAYGLFLPEMRQSFDLSETVVGLIGAGSYVVMATMGARLSNAS